MEIERLKNSLIVALFECYWGEFKSAKLKAIEILKELATYYNIPLKNLKRKIPLQVAIERFFTSGEGYVVTINELYTSLIF